MVSTFKISIIYLIIISRHTCISVPIDKATPSIREIVKENMVDFNNILVNIADDKIRFKLEGKVEEVIKRAVEAEIKNEMLLQDKGRLKQEKERSDLYRVLLGISHRVDTLEQILSCDSNVQLSGARDVRWKKILNLETPIVQHFRSKIIAAGLTVELFAKAIQKICQERHDRTGHGDVSLPEEIGDDDVEQILTKMKIPKDDFYKRAIELLISPLTLPPTTLPK